MSHAKPLIPYTIRDSKLKVQPTTRPPVPLQVAAATFGLNAPWLPAGEVDPAVVGFLQGSILLGSLGISLALTRKIGAQPWKALLPQCAVTLALTAGLWHVIYD